MWRQTKGYSNKKDIFEGSVKGSLTRDFQLQVFFMNQCPLGPWVLPWGRFEFFRKFAKIFLNKCLSPVSTTPAIICSPVSRTPAINLSPVSLTPAINLVTDFQWSPVLLIPTMTTTPAINLSPVTTTPAINLLPVTTTSVIRVCGVSMNTSFHGGSNETIGGRVRLRRPELLPFWYEVVLAAPGASNQGVWSVYGCVFSWWFQWHHQRPRPTPAAGDIAVSTVFRRCRWHRRTIFRRCRWHRR